MPEYLICFSNYYIHNLPEYTTRLAQRIMTLFLAAYVPSPIKAVILVAIIAPYICIRFTLTDLNGNHYFVSSFASD